jgi:hypothetical protein
LAQVVREALAVQTQFLPRSLPQVAVQVEIIQTLHLMARLAVAVVVVAHRLVQVLQHMVKVQAVQVIHQAHRHRKVQVVV